MNFGPPPGRASVGERPTLVGGFPCALMTKRPVRSAGRIEQITRPQIHRTRVEQSNCPESLICPSDAIVNTSVGVATECPTTRPCEATAIWVARKKTKSKTRKAVTSIYKQGCKNVVDLLESQVTKMPHFQRLLDIFLKVATAHEVTHFADANTLRIPRISLLAALDSGPTTRREDGGQLPPVNLLVVSAYQRSSVGSDHRSHRRLVHRQPV